MGFSYEWGVGWLCQPARLCFICQSFPFYRLRRFIIRKVENYAFKENRRYATNHSNKSCKTYHSLTLKVLLTLPKISKLVFWLFAG